MSRFLAAGLVATGYLLVVVGAAVVHGGLGVLAVGVILVLEGRALTVPG